MKFLITGGAGFIGSALIRFLIKETEHELLNLDKLSYSGSLESLNNISTNSRYKFIKGDICNRKLISDIFFQFNPEVVVHLAAETHVDRSIDQPAEFVKTNILGTSIMLECAYEYWKRISGNKRFIFHHISTDEVFGSLGKKGFFKENTAYNPNSPYSASKASSDHLVRAWNKTYGFPTFITNSSNNYGPYQFPEKLIPLTIINALENKTIPIYGNGKQIRDWLYVEDHIQAIYKVITKGDVGETYNIGGNNEKSNIEVANAICEILDEIIPNKINNNSSYKKLIKFVSDRPGHDQRYAIDTHKIKKRIDWKPVETFETGLRKTVEWYICNADWYKNTKGNQYKRQGLGIIKKNLKR
jgi:dTDP-glucose 4,6-dehydratase